MAISLLYTGHLLSCGCVAALFHPNNLLDKLIGILLLTSFLHIEIYWVYGNCLARIRLNNQSSDEFLFIWIICG